MKRRWGDVEPLLLGGSLADSVDRAGDLIFSLFFGTHKTPPPPPSRAAAHPISSSLIILYLI